MVKYGIAIGLITLALTGSAFARGGRCAGGRCGGGECAGGSCGTASWNSKPSSGLATQPAAETTDKIVKQESAAEFATAEPTSRYARQTVLRRRMR